MPVKASYTDSKGLCLKTHRNDNGILGTLSDDSKVPLLSMKLMLNILCVLNIVIIHRT